MKYIFVLLGGAAGALLRYVSTLFVDKLFLGGVGGGTLFVNVIGSLLIGFLFMIFEYKMAPDKLRLLVITGFLGAYTTFSTYSRETVHQFLAGNIKGAVLNIVLNNVLCLLFCLMGMFLAKTTKGHL